MRIKCENTISSFDLGHIEERLSRELQGKRLICEATFSPEEIDAWLQELLPQGILAWDRCPFLVAVTTVGTGIYQYKCGDLWDAFPGLDTTADRKQWGELFKRFLEKHETLEAFQNLGGLKYVAPILAHGGIPQYCLPDFFEVLTRYGDPEQSSSEFIEFICDKPNCMTNIDKPVQRFLLHGGEVAEEFVARSLALWQSREYGDGGGTHGLPNRVVKAFSKWYTKHKPMQHQHIRRLTKPRPEIRISPGDLWVYLHLPRCDDHPEIGPNACWKFNERSWAVSRNHKISLPFSDCWIVKCENREVNLQGISSSAPALFFDSSSGKLIPDPCLRRLPEHLWAVFSQSSVVEPEPVYREEISSWPGYVVAVFDLKGQKSLSIGGHWFEVRRPFFHVDRDPVVMGVTTKDGIPIFHSPPKIEWDGMVNLSLSRCGKDKVNIDVTSDALQIWFYEPGEYEFILRGPFGQNVRKRFVLIPGLKIRMQPEVMWPNIPRIKYAVYAEQVDIRTSDGQSPPFISHDPYICFYAVYGETQTDLIVNVPQLRWRVLISSEEASQWKTKPITLSVQDLERADYPRLACEIGQLAKKMNVSLIGKHGAINPPQGRCSNLSRQNTWAFDLRMVLDQVRQSGLAEEFDISVRTTDGIQLFCGSAMSARPKWDLKNFHAEWKKKNGEHVIHVTWKEGGIAITGRWLALIPLWRPWEEAIQIHKLDESERSQFIWRLSDIRPGRYVVQAIHAPWGVEDWTKAKHVKQEVIDVCKIYWKQVFSKKQCTLNSVENYTESLMAHWYRHELVRYPPSSPLALTFEQISNFLGYLNKINEIVALRIPKNISGALNIFYQNPNATTKAVSSKVPNISNIWRKVLPSQEIIFLIPKQNDKDFIREVAFQYTILNTAAKAVKQEYKKKYLSPPLKEWHQFLCKNKPPAGDVIFLCEKFDLFAGKECQRLKYKELKRIYRCEEVV